MEKFFSPKSVAIIGASRTPGKVGYVLAENMQSFRGKYFFVNPNPEPIMGRQTYPSIKKIPDEIDLAVVAVKSTLVPGVVKECIEKKVGSIVVISSGFSEIGPEGKKLEEQLKKVVGNRARVIGPNTVGIMDTSSGLDTVFLPHDRLKRPKPGGIAFVSQSGAVGSTIMDWLAEEGIGVSKFISYGNAMDVNEADLFEHLGGDQRTSVIAVYLEGIKSQGKRFMQVVDKVTRKKPIVFLKSGKSQKGTQAAASHTGSLAGSAKVYSTVFRQFGAVEADDWEELIDFSKAFSMQPFPKGSRLLIVTNGGGFGVLATDQAENQGLVLDPLSKEDVDALKKVTRGYASLHNPLDLTADSDAEMYGKVVDECIDRYDGVIVITLFQVPTLKEDVIDVVAGMQKHGKPVYCCATGGHFTIDLSERLEARGVPVFPTPKRAVDAFAAALRYENTKKSR